MKGVDDYGEGSEWMQEVGAACGEDLEGPLLLEGANRDHGPRRRWGDDYSDETGMMADATLHGPAHNGVTNGAQGGCEEYQGGPLPLEGQPGSGREAVGSTFGCAASDGQTDWLHLAKGDQVELHGLATCGLNGRCGRVVQLHEATARLAVCLDGGGGMKAVKPSLARKVSWADVDVTGPPPAPQAALSLTATIVLMRQKRTPVTRKDSPHITLLRRQQVPSAAPRAVGVSPLTFSVSVDSWGIAALLGRGTRAAVRLVDTPWQ